MNIQAIGLVAGSLTTAAWVPQLVRTSRTGSADELSWPYLLVFASGVSTWMVYAVLAADLPVFVANLVSTVLILGLVAVKGRSGRSRVLMPDTLLTATSPEGHVATEERMADEFIALCRTEPGIEPSRVIEQVENRLGRRRANSAD